MLLMESPGMLLDPSQQLNVGVKEQNGLEDNTFRLLMGRLGTLTGIRHMRRLPRSACSVYSMDITASLQPSTYTTPSVRCARTASA